VREIWLNGLARVPDAITSHPSVETVRFAAYDLEQDVRMAIERICRAPKLERLHLSCIESTTLPHAVAAADLSALGISLHPREKPSVDLDGMCQLLGGAQLDEL